MPMFYEEEVFVGDSMFDMNKGIGRVIQVTANSIEIVFQDRKYIYSLEGVQRGKTSRTLYWSTPYIMAPMKNAEHWTTTRTKFNAILAILRNDY